MFELGTLALIVLFAAIVLIAQGIKIVPQQHAWICLLYTSPSPRDKRQSRMPSSA